MWNNSPVSFLQALGLLFIGLKLTGHVDWAWWWVLSPLWLRYTGIIMFWLFVDAMMKRWKERTHDNLRKMSNEFDN